MKEKEGQLLTISEMANICRISRQTLIYYDKHDVFKPEYMDEKGYRYYSIYQVPYLREICALKNNNLSLREIVENFQNRNIKNTQDLLRLKKQNLEEEIADLQLKLKSIEERLAYYDYAKQEMTRVNQPYIREFPERKILFCPWDTDDMNRSHMHYTHMKLRNRCNEFQIKIDRGWGAMLRKATIHTAHPYREAGAYINLPPDFENIYGIPEGHYLVIPAGTFACMCKYGMPYELEYVNQLFQWIEQQGYTVTGDILDECMLDTTFYTEDQKKDFCQIQIPVEISAK